MDFPLDQNVELDFFRQSWEKSNDPFWLCECAGDDFVVVAVNPAERLIDERIAPGLSLRAYFGDGIEAEALISGYVQCRDTARTVSFRQQPVISGVERLFHTLLVPVTIAGGRVTHICGTGRDLSQFLQAQRELEALNRQLEQRVAERTRALNAANAELREANHELEHLAMSDSLTGLSNRRHFFEYAGAEVVRARRYRHPLSVQMLDLDHFKIVNDRFGHLAGDEVLRAIANILRDNLRGNDLAGRFGGEEFAILLPETDIDAAVCHAERLCQAIASHCFGAELPHITVSIGVSTLKFDETTIEPVLLRADNALYRAKMSGRARVSASFEGANSESITRVLREGCAGKPVEAG
jgi:diguanylate cyclase (GGDEF)-like protein